MGHIMMPVIRSGHVKRLPCADVLAQLLQGCVRAAVGHQPPRATQRRHFFLTEPAARRAANNTMC